MTEERYPLLKRVAVGMAGLALVIGIAAGFFRAVQVPEVGDPVASQLAAPDPLSAELRRCSTLPQSKAMDDTTCRRAWILNRQRFFGQSKELLSDLPDRNKE